MNYHSHERRDEVWTVVSGSGQVVVDGVTRGVSTGDVIDLPVGWKHTVIALPVGWKHTVIAFGDGMWIIEFQMGEDIKVPDKKSIRFRGCILQHFHSRGKKE